MKLVSWNVNGIRSLKHTLKETLKFLDGDIICFQEVKAARDMIEEDYAIVPDYNSYFTFPKYSSGYSGVATFCKDTVRPVFAEEGLSGQYYTENGPTPPDLTDFLPKVITSLDSEGRALITLHNVRFPDYERLLAVINVYCPRVDPEKPDRMEFQIDFLNLLEKRVEALMEYNCHILIVGDINCSHRPIDHCCPGDLQEFEDRESRKWLTTFLQKERRGQQVIDTFRHFHPTATEAFTCWRPGTRVTNYGTRLDYIFANSELLPFLEDSILLSHVLGSDHCPVAVSLKNCELIPAKLCPEICTKYWGEFSGKQTSITEFVLKGNQHEEQRKEIKRKTNKSQSSIKSFFQKSENTPCVKSERQQLASSNNVTPKTVEASRQAAAWKSLLKGPSKPPKCKGHGEETVLRTVKKEGPNFGKQFYCCSRPEGAATNPEARCNFFEWKKKR